MGFRVDERFYGGQRREARKTINREFESVEAFIVEYVQNISKSGVFIKSKDPLPVGTTVNLKFAVVMDDLETLEGLGKVVRSIKPGSRHTPGMGVVFTELTHYSSKLLEKILARPETRTRSGEPVPDTPENPLKAVFEARSVAFVGASNSPTTMGTIQMLNTLRSTFQGPVIPVHPSEETVLGQKAYRRLTDLPEPVDLAVLIVPTHAVLGVVQDAIARGIRRLVITTGGFREGGADGQARERELVRLASESGLRFVGPNCIGVINAHTGLNTTFYPYKSTAGALGLVSQSGTYITQTLDLLSRWGISLSKAVSVGNSANIDLVDGLEYFAEDDATRAIGLYIEGLPDGRRFLTAARRATARKPVVALYVGGTEGGARSGKSHTGALAGPDEIYEGAFAQAGIIRARTIADLYQWGWALATQPIPKGKRLAILTHSGGPATSMADAVYRAGLALPPFSPALQEKIRALIPPTAACTNPIDLTFSLDQRLMGETLPDLLLSDPDIDGLLVHGIQGVGFFGDIHERARGLFEIDVEQMGRFFELSFRPLIKLAAKHQKPLVVSSFFDRRDNLVKMFQDAGVPVFDTPERAVSAMAALVRYGQFRASPVDGPPDRR